MKKLALILSVAMLAAPALADDLPEFQPPWRGEVSTTLQIWEFNTPEQINVLPDGPGPLIDDGTVYQVGYLPSTMVTEIRPFNNEPWIEEDPFAPTGTGRFGIWMLSGEMDVLVDNHNPPNDLKLINVQLTWHPGSEAGAVPGIKDIGPLPVENYQHVADIPHCNGWITSLFTWEFDGNPPDEWFTIHGDIYVDQLVVDTWCVPEPATMGLMGIGGLFALLRRRRK